MLELQGKSDIVTYDFGALPTAAITCNKCGDTSLLNLIVLGVMDAKGGKYSLISGEV